MARTEQNALMEEPPGRRRVWCQAPGCGIELTDPISRMRRLGPEHDPEPRTRTPDHEVDQDPIPGL